VFKLSAAKKLHFHPALALQLPPSSNLAASNQHDELEEDEDLLGQAKSCEMEHMEMYDSVLESSQQASSCAGRTGKASSWQLSHAKHVLLSERKIPAPPPLPPTGLPTFAAQQQKVSPIGELRYIVKHWALASPDLPKKSVAAKSPQRLLGSMLQLLDAAALPRHIGKRSNSTSTDDSAAAASVSASSTGAVKSVAEFAQSAASSQAAVDEERRGLEGSVAATIEWMASYQGGCIGKHARLREVEALCLRWVTLYLRHCVAAGEAVEAQTLLASSLLPVIEENLDASIEDMERPDSMFALSISLVYTFTFVPGLHVLLNALSPEWRPPQRRSVAQICQKADELAATYLQRLHAPPSPPKSSKASAVAPGASDAALTRLQSSRSAGVGAELERADSWVMEAVRQVIAAVTACVPIAESVVPDCPQDVEEESVDRVAWATLPSVVSWAQGTEVKGWQEQYAKRYVEAMNELKLEAVAVNG